MPVGTAANPHLAEQCDDDYCPRLPCRMFKEGARRGHEKGFDEGYAEGFDKGFTAGYSDGAASSGGR